MTTPDVASVKIDDWEPEAIRQAEPTYVLRGAPS
jgi:hypothetical protein